jgi:hypothetical protein
MFASVSLAFGISSVFGIALAAVLLMITRRGRPVADGPATRPTALAWWTLAFGLMSATAFALTTWWTITNNVVGRGLNLISITFAFAAVVTGIGNLARHDRHWPTWIGMIAGLIPALFWTAFAVFNSFRF